MTFSPRLKTERGSSVAAVSPAALELTHDGQSAASSTRELAAGPYTVVIATAIPELALRLHSTYIGSESSDSIVVHLELGASKDRPLAERRYPHGDLPVVHARQRCLLEHAAHLQQLVTDLTGARVAIDVAGEAGDSAEDAREAL